MCWIGNVRLVTVVSVLVGRKFGGAGAAKATVVMVLMRMNW